MQRVTISRATTAEPVQSDVKQADTSATGGERRLSGSSIQLVPLLIDIRGLAVLLSRSVASLHRDDAAGRLPAALRISGSKRWRYGEIIEWTEADCPCRAEWEELKQSQR